MTTHKNPQLSHNLAYNFTNKLQNTSDRQDKSQEEDDDKTQLTFGHQLSDTQSINQSVDSEHMRKY